MDICTARSDLILLDVYTAFSSSLILVLESCYLRLESLSLTCAVLDPLLPSRQLSRDHISQLTPISVRP
jgi:hypothetical protein